MEAQQTSLQKENALLRTNEGNIASQEYMRDAISQGSGDGEQSFAGNANSFYKESLTETNKADGSSPERQRQHHLYKSNTTSQAMNLGL